MKKITVLYICHERKTIGGAALSLLNLINSVKKYVYSIILLDNRQDSKVYDFFYNKGIECITIPFEWNIRANKNTVYSILKYIPKLLRNKITNYFCKKNTTTIEKQEYTDCTF